MNCVELNKEKECVRQGWKIQTGKIEEGEILAPELCFLVRYFMNCQAMKQMNAVGQLSWGGKPEKNICVYKDDELLFNCLILYTYIYVYVYNYLDRSPTYSRNN